MTTMMKTHVKLMQKQLEEGFGLIASKMNTLEDKLHENDDKIKKFNTNAAKEVVQKEKADQDNKRLFQLL